MDVNLICLPVVVVVTEQPAPKHGTVGMVIVVLGVVGTVGRAVPAVAVGTGPVSHPTQAANMGSS